MDDLSALSLEELWQLFPIILKEYNDIYPLLYKKQEVELVKILGNNIRRISHIGSTAIKTIVSKPIIDILIEIDDQNIEEVIDKLNNNNWLCMSHKKKPLKVSFNKGYTPNGFADEVYHAHVRAYGDCDELYFRDYLNSHEDVATDYEKLKLALGIKHKFNRDAYTEAKTSFIEKYSAIANQELQNKYNKD